MGSSLYRQAIPGLVVINNLIVGSKSALALSLFSKWNKQAIEYSRGLCQAGTRQDGAQQDLTGAVPGPRMERSACLRRRRTKSSRSGFQSIPTLWPRNPTSGNVPQGKHLAVGNTFCTERFHPAFPQSRATTHMPSRRLGQWTWEHVPNGGAGS